ncbi:MAG: Spermidine/putrescine import ABC transporter permease protein PotB, partial [uncultured Nocardioidaceae bacterium]
GCRHVRRHRPARRTLARAGGAPGPGAGLLRAPRRGAGAARARLHGRHPRPFRRRRVDPDPRQLPPGRGPALPRGALVLARHRRARHGAGAAAGLPDGVRDQPAAAPVADGRPRARRRPVLDQLPHPHVRLDRPAQQPRGRERRAARAGDHRRAGRPALQRRRGGRRPGLRLPPPHGAAGLRRRRAARPRAGRGVGEPRRGAAADVLERPAAPDAARGAHRVGPRVRPQPRQLRRPRAPRRRQDRHGRQPHPRPVPQGAGLAVRVGARLRRGRRDGDAVRGAGRGHPPGRGTPPWL